MTDQSNRLILKDPKSKLSVHNLAREDLWLLVKRVQADPEKDIPYELVWATPDEETTIHYIEDPLVKFPYLVVRGKDIEKNVSRIQNFLDLYSDEEIIDMVKNARTRKQKMKAIALLGVAAPQRFDPQIFSLLQNAMSDKDAEVRRTAVWVTGYPAWPQFRESLERVAVSDPDKTVRQDAGFVLEGFKSQGI